MAISAEPMLPERPSREELRDWWHYILRRRGKYPSYAFCLALPSDSEMLKYLEEYGVELDMISEEHCLVIALNDNKFRRSGFDSELQKEEVGRFARYWSYIARKNISEGYSLRVARVFDLTYEEFPCLLIFKDIRSTEHIRVALSEMTTEEIADRLQKIFLIIRNAVTQEEDIIIALQRSRNKEELSRKGKAIISQLRSFTGKTFETAMQAWIKTTIN